MPGHAAAGEVCVTQGNCLRESTDGDSDIVDGAGVAGLYGAAYLKPQVLQLAVGLPDGKLASLAIGRCLWNARLRHSYMLLSHD